MPEVHAGTPNRVRTARRGGDSGRDARLHRVRRLDWHRATIGVLAWAADGTLLVGDNDGELAVWSAGGVGE